MESQRRHVRAENHAFGLAANEVGDRAAGGGYDLGAACAARELAMDVCHRGTHRLRDGVDHRRRKHGSGSAVKRHDARLQAGELCPQLADRAVEQKARLGVF